MPTPTLCPPRCLSLVSQRQPEASISGVEECGNPAPTPRARRARGEVVEGVYRRYPADGARGRPLRHPNRPNRGHLRRRTRRKWYPLKGCVSCSYRLPRLATGEGPSLLDRVLIDHTIRQLPPDAGRTLANHPDTVDELVRQLEN